MQKRERSNKPTGMDEKENDSRRKKQRVGTVAMRTTAAGKQKLPDGTDDPNGTGNDGKLSGEYTLPAIRFHLTQESYGELSTFWVMERPLMFDGKKYRTCEHLYQSLKYNYPKAPPASKEFAEEIRIAEDPWDAKMLGKQVVVRRTEWQRRIAEKVLQYNGRGATPRTDWRRAKLRAMRFALWLKFTGDPQCRKALLDTGDSMLIEETKVDSFWGTGVTGNGKNWLGVLLMETRKRLRDLAGHTDSCK